MDTPMTLAFAFSPTARLALVGAGKMGGALLKGWLDNGLDKRSALVIDPSPAPESVAMLKEVGIPIHAEAPAGVTAKVIVVAVKPQIIGDVLPNLRPLVGRETVVLSIAAGTTLKQLAAGVGDTAIVRSIPNTPAQVGRGITVAIANASADKNAKALVTTLLEAVGEVVWVEKEGMIDSATAVSGSGPAYIFHMVEALTAAAVSVGFDKESAAKLARATVEGAGELLYQSPLGADVLRQNVTSPKGTTAAALKVLMGRGGLTPLMKKAVAAARKRSRELAK
jgi:pyrroline-5-carboxylate reductase